MGQLRTLSLVLWGAGTLIAGNCSVAGADESRRVDTALVLAVDVSESVTAERYSLQMQGIAAAFRDPLLQDVMLASPHKAMLVALIEWSSKPFISIPWTLVDSRADANGLADLVVAIPRTDVRLKFTCLSLALRSINDELLPLLPLAADRTVIDVSGDGTDNCDGDLSVDAIRDDLVAHGTTINGLPVLEGDEAWRLEDWYRQHVIGGRSALLVSAHGYRDIQRAILQKFLTEISGN